MKRIYLSAVISGALLLGAASYAFVPETRPAIIGNTQAVGDLITDTANANPDYICIKSADSGNSPCVIQSCSPWSGNTRSCTGVRATMVGYYAVRTGCESWYTTIKLSNNQGTGASGRHEGDHTIWVSPVSVSTCTDNISGATVDPSTAPDGSYTCTQSYPSYSQTCNTVEVDSTPPVGAPDATYN